MSYLMEATNARRKVLELIYKAQTSHIGSNFSCIDILTVLFDKIDLDKDKFVLSAGWKAAAFYYFLWRKGRITEEELNSFCQPGSKFIGLAEPMSRMVRGMIEDRFIPFAGGSMCMGIAAGVGFALSKKLKNEDGTVYVLESDGGLQGGITWEASLLAAHHHLNNLVVMVDNNQLQAMGPTHEILNIAPIDKKFHSLGWEVREVDGHDFKEIEDALKEPKIWKYKPTFIIANTIKGKGVSFMENNNLFHYKAPNEEEYLKALEELNV